MGYKSRQPSQALSDRSNTGAESHVTWDVVSREDVTDDLGEHVDEVLLHHQDGHEPNRQRFGRHWSREGDQLGAPRTVNGRSGLDHASYYSACVTRPPSTTESL